ncbi:MAG: hypothetical protein ABH873_06670 [Candidatus Firestonebacteria bacterium]
MKLKKVVLLSILITAILISTSFAVNVKGKTYVSFGFGYFISNFDFVKITSTPTLGFTTGKYSGLQVVAEYSYGIDKNIEIGIYFASWILGVETKYSTSSSDGSILREWAKTIPILAFGKYNFELSPNFTLYAKFGIGYSFNSIKTQFSSTIPDLSFIDIDDHPNGIAYEPALGIDTFFYGKTGFIFLECGYYKTNVQNLNGIIINLGAKFIL